MGLKDRIERDMKHYPPRDNKEANQHAMVRAILREAALSLEKWCPEGREMRLALTKLEEAQFWANAALARARAED